jgi:hypothetical protein
VFYRPLVAGSAERRLTIMLNRVNLGGLEQVHMIVLGVEDLAPPRP